MAWYGNFVHIITKDRLVLLRHVYFSVKMLKKVKYILPLIIILFGSYLVIRGGLIKNMNNGTLNVWIQWEPFNTDPLQYDAFVHHVMFRSVLGSLVSDYKAGTFVGLISDSWSSSEDHKRWVFHIRPDIYFENGDKISPKHVARSWIRLAYMLKMKGSHSDFLDSLDGKENILAPTSEISGLQTTDDEVIVQLSKPIPNLLETVSFGLYSIVHPADYNPITGIWNDSSRLTSASAYRIKNWAKQHVTLELRDDFPKDLIHPKAFKLINISWSSQQRENADIIIGDSNEKILSRNHTFFGPVPNAIAYARCFPSSDDNAICNSKENRAEIRQILYEAMINGGVKPIRSFFPLIMKGISEIKTGGNTESSEEAIRGKTLSFYIRINNDNEIFKSIRDNIKKICEEKGIIANEVVLNGKQSLEMVSGRAKKPYADLGIIATDITTRDPDSDIRFMFLSKEGICLPDMDGSIHDILKYPNFSPQEINRHLWDQGLIIPLGHYSMGFWVNSTVDVSQLNTLIPPIEFLWVGLN